jgi:hypothetical protein
VPDLAATAGAGLLDLGEAAGQMAEAALRIADREAVIDRDARDTDFAQQLDEHLNNLIATENLADKNVIKSAQAFGEQKFRAALEGHPGGVTSTALLENSLQQRLNIYQSALATRNIEAGNTQLDASARRKINAIVAGVGEDRQSSLEAAFAALDKTIEWLAQGDEGRFNVHAANAWRETGREEIISARVESFLSVGDPKTARAIMDNPQWNEDLTPATRGRLNRAIDTMASEIGSGASEGRRARETATAALGPSATAEEVERVTLAILGVDAVSPVKLSIYTVDRGNQTTIYAINPETGVVASRITVEKQNPLRWESASATDDDGNPVTLILGFDQLTGEEKARHVVARPGVFETHVVNDQVVVTNEKGEEVNKFPVAPIPQTIQFINDPGMLADVYPNVNWEDMPQGVTVERNIATGETELIFPKYPEGTVRDEQIKYWVGRGVTHDRAVAIVDGLEKMRVDPNGRVILTNIVKGTAVETTIAPDPEMLIQYKKMIDARDVLVSTMTITQMLDRNDVAGLSGFFTRLGMRTIGQFVDFGKDSQRTITYQAAIKASSQDLIRALTLNKRYPIKEQERLMNLLGHPDAWESRESYKASLEGVVRFVALQLARANVDRFDQNLSHENRSQAYVTAIHLSDYLQLAGYDQKGRELPYNILPGEEAEEMSDDELRELLKEGKGPGHEVFSPTYAEMSDAQLLRAAGLLGKTEGGLSSEELTKASTAYAQKMRLSGR